MSEEDKIQKKTNRLNLFTTKMLRQVEQKNKATTTQFQKVGRTVVEERMRGCPSNQDWTLGRHKWWTRIFKMLTVNQKQFSPTPWCFIVRQMK